MRWRASRWIALILVFAGLSAREATAGTPLSTAEPVLAEMARKLADQSLPMAERLDLIKAFGDWATPQVDPPLIAALKDPSPRIRAAAARALGWRGNAAAVAPLRERVEAADEAVPVKAAAVDSLGRIGDRSVRPLVVGLTRDPSAPIREAAVASVSLGALVDPADRTTYLIQFAEDRAFDPQGRVQALRLLSTVKEDRVVESVSKILEHEPRLTIALPPRRAPTEQETMILRQSQAKDVAAWAASALGALEARSAVPLLLVAAEEPKDLFLRLMSVQALLRLGAPEALPVFLGRLKDPVPDTRIIAIAGVVKVGNGTGMDSLLALLSDDAAMVRAQAVKAVAEVGGASVKPRLEAMQATEPDAQVQTVLEAVLSRLSP